MYKPYTKKKRTYTPFFIFEFLIVILFIFLFSFSAIPGQGGGGVVKPVDSAAAANQLGGIV